MGIVLPIVALGGAGAVAYLLWKKYKAPRPQDYIAPPSAIDAPIERMSTADAQLVVPSALEKAFVKTPSGEWTKTSTGMQKPLNGLGSYSSSLTDHGSIDSAMDTMEAAAGVGSYYDVSAAGAPYQGMLGLGEIAPMNTVVPTDAIHRASNFPRVSPITRPFASPTVRTGGVFSRDLFTGV